MGKLKEFILMFVAINFHQLVFSQEVVSISMLGRIDSVEAVLELHNIKMEQIETQMMGFKEKVDRLEIKDQDILGDLSKLDKRIVELGTPVSLFNQPKSGTFKFELGTDEITKCAASENGKGPSSCKDLEEIGYTQRGFYTVRSNSAVIKTVYCDFVSGRAEQGIIMAGSISSKTMNPPSSNETNISMPTNCKDLQLMGHTLSGFYLVKIPRQNLGTQIETVFCNFQLSSHLNEGFETRIGIADIKSSSVHFHVERKGGNDRAIGEKITFKKEILNVGNGFDWKNQRFVAPYTGIYFFSISGSKEWGSNDWASIKVRLDGREISEALSSHKSNFGGFSCQLSRKLNANDTIELIMGKDKFYLLYFTGWMVEQNLA